MLFLRFTGPTKPPLPHEPHTQLNHAQCTRLCEIRDSVAQRTHAKAATYQIAAQIFGQKPALRTIRRIFRLATQHEFALQQPAYSGLCESPIYVTTAEIKQLIWCFLAIFAMLSLLISVPSTAAADSERRPSEKINGLQPVAGVPHSPNTVFATFQHTPLSLRI